MYAPSTCAAVRGARSIAAGGPAARSRVPALRGPCPPAATTTAPPRTTTEPSPDVLTHGAAASFLLAKVAAMSPAMLLAASASALVTKQPDITHATTAVKERTMEQVAAPTVARAYPSDWLVVGSASQWFDLNRRACAEGKLLATVFISAKAAAAHGGTIERLRRAYAAGEGAQVQFVFVDVGASYGQRLQNCRMCRTASLARGRSALSVSRVSHTAAIHGLDVALSAFLPEGCLRASPTLLLRSGATARDGSVWSCAATRATQMEQLVADWAFTRGARNTAAQACTAARGPAVARGPTAVARGPANVAWVVAPAGVKRALAAHHT